MTTSAPLPGMIEISIDGKSARVSSGTTVFDAARMNGINIPTLCHLQNQTPVGVCRLCVVDTGARVLSASCVRPVEPAMKVVDRKSTRLNSSHSQISYAVFCLKKKNKKQAINNAHPKATIKILMD